jgi:hypothetical protein
LILVIVRDDARAVEDTAPGKARVTVRFKNSDTAKTVVLDLVKLKTEWQIGEITWQRDGKAEALSALFR